jgi:hypothetical protein
MTTVSGMFLPILCTNRVALKGQSHDIVYFWFFHQPSSPEPMAIVIKQFHLKEGALEVTEKVRTAQHAVAHSTCHSCPSYKHFPPTPCLFYSGIHTKPPVHTITFSL